MGCTAISQARAPTITKPNHAQRFQACNTLYSILNYSNEVEGSPKHCSGTPLVFYFNCCELRVKFVHFFVNEWYVLKLSVLHL